VLHGLLHHRGDGVGVTYIALQPGGHEIIRRRGLVIGGDDPGSRLGEDPDGGRPDAGSAAGNQDPSALQRVSHARERNGTAKFRLVIRSGVPLAKRAAG
jgi:hypothetical protein